MTGAASIALLADILLGEPPAPLHPTVWMGRWIAAGRKRRRSSAPLASLIEGSLVLASGIAASGAAALAADALLRRASASARPWLVGAALKPALSLRALVAAATEVQRELELLRLVAARRVLGRHLVSRDTSRLSASEVAGAAIESVAENLSDGLVAPLLAFRLGGLGAAYAYRMVNTADAMLGYRDAEREWFGKPSARVDDIANLLPSRVTALLICCSASRARGSAKRAARIALSDACLTASPNAGWPMAAMAGALGVNLVKRDHYSLNAGARAPVAADIARSCRIATAAALLSVALVEVA